MQFNTLSMNINSISDTILDKSSSPEALREALNTFSQLCSKVSGIQPDPGFDAWAGDSLLDSGVAISPQAAAHCVQDYQRSVAFIRGVYAAMNALKLRIPNQPIKILYAGCGPFATLLLPLLGKFRPCELEINLLDIHQSSLDSLEPLLEYFDLHGYAVRTIQGDACHYRHPVKLHLVIAETMQKALEQEPQFAVTANLAPQLEPAGIFIPERIEVALCLADLEHEKQLVEQSRRLDPKTLETSTGRFPLAAVYTLAPECAYKQMQAAQYNVLTAKHELETALVEIPPEADGAGPDAALFTRIKIFEQHQLGDYESQITLPLKCHELTPATAGQRYRVSYQLGSYPRFNIELL